MDMRLAVLGVAAFVIIGVLAIQVYETIKLRRMVRQGWGRLPSATVYDKEENLEQAYQDAKAFVSKHSEVDSITWYDLDIFDIFEQINHTYSSIGSEALYQRLRTYDFDESDREEMESLIAFFKENPKIREETEFSFARLGKKDRNFVVQYLADGKGKRLSSLWKYVGLGLLPLIGAGVWLAGFSAGVFILLGAVCFNTLYYMRKKIMLEAELTSMSYLVQTISSAQRLSKLELPVQDEVKQFLRPLQGVLKFAVSFRVKSGGEAEVLFDTLNSILMMPFISYHFVLDRLEKYNQEAIQLWNILGKLEVAIAILNYRTLLPLWCRPEFKEGGVEAEDVYHPLVEGAVANPVDWRQNTLVTGSNASGKSTYVKAIAISCILSQTIYTVLATSFTLQHGHVLTSMAVEDDVLAGDSYFISEIKSIKRVLDMVKTGERCYCFIDEILKGTNTIERVAASSSVVDWLYRYPSLAFVATHDIELTEILKHSCDNVHFEEQVTEEHGVTFDYLLRQGPSTTRNAINLLKVMDYPQEVVDRARAEAESFDLLRKWQVYGEG